MNSVRAQFYSFYQARLRLWLSFLFYLIPGKRPLFELLRRIWKPSPSVYRWLRFKGLFKTSVNGKEFMLLSDGEYFEASFFWAGALGGVEKISLQSWAVLSESAKYVLDLGANTGVYALIAKTVNPAARVVGFEPVHRICDKFKENCRINGYDIECVEAAASNYDGIGTIFDPGNHIYSVTVNQNHNPVGVKFKEVSIRTMKLASFIEEKKIPHIDLIKLDVESHEPEVLEGMGPYLSKMKPDLLIEITSEENAARIEKYLSGLGYLYFDIDEIDPPRYVSSLSKSSKWNFLICQKATAERIGLKF